MYFEDKYFSVFIVLIEQMSLSDRLYFFEISDNMFFVIVNNAMYFEI